MIFLRTSKILVEKHAFSVACITSPPVRADLNILVPNLVPVFTENLLDFVQEGGGALKLPQGKPPYANHPILSYKRRRIIGGLMDELQPVGFRMVVQPAGKILHGIENLLQIVDLDFFFHGFTSYHNSMPDV